MKHFSRMDMENMNQGLADMRGAGPRPRLSFDRLAAIFDDQRALPPQPLAALHRVFTRMADAGKATMIEPGAGTGRIAIPALAAGLSVTGIDISAPMLDAFRRRLANVPGLVSRCELHTGDATMLPFDRDRFDAGVLAQVLYLIPDWQRALDELIRVVKPGGTVVLVQERTAMSPELHQWDTAWRRTIEGAGHVPVSQAPDDATAAAALADRTNDVRECELASWTFGQPVREALAGLDRLRPLYPSVSSDGWEHALAAFRHWLRSSGLDDEAWLGGAVTLTLVTGTVPSGRA